MRYSRIPLAIVALLSAFAAGTWAGTRVREHDQTGHPGDIVFRILIPIKSATSVSELTNYQGKKVRIARVSQGDRCLPPVPPFVLSLGAQALTLEAAWPSLDPAATSLQKEDLERPAFILASESAPIPSCARSVRVNYGE